MSEVRHRRFGRSAPMLAGLAIGAAFAGLGGYAHRGPANDATARPRTAYSGLSLFGQAFETVRDHYVEPPDGRALVRSAIRGMLASLDPHSGYVDGQAARATDAFVRGEIGDAGIELAQRGGKLTVIGAIEGASAASAGLRAGDVIVAIDDAPTHGLLLDEAAERLRGPVHSTVRLTMQRGAGGLWPLAVTRDVQTIKAVRAHLVDGDIGYIRIAQFTEATAGSLKDAMRRLDADVPGGVRGYILDLRNDPGGFVDQAIATVNAFVEKGEIVSTRGRAPGSDGQVYATPGSDLSKGRPMVALVNGGTASAAEIVAGALQDLKRATLIGTRTFGKGSIQSTLPLGDGELKLTTALYFTPSGRSIQAEGIIPDRVVLEDAPPEIAGPDGGAGEASLDRHLANPHGEDPGPSQTWVPAEVRDDKQLGEAVGWLRGDRGQ